MDRRLLLLSAGLLGLLLAGCAQQREEPAAEPPVAADETRAAATVPEPAANPAATAGEAAPPTGTVADAATDPAAGEPAPGEGFDPSDVPVTTATLPPFPFFDVPEGLASAYRQGERDLSFDAQYFIAGSEPVLVEGRVFRDKFRLAGGARRYTGLEFHRNYENAVRALGGAKVDQAQYTP